MGISLTTFGAAYTQNFDSLASTGTSSTLPAGWLISEIGTSALANGAYTAGTGSSNSGDTYSFGNAGSTDRALGSLNSGSNNPTFGASFTNDTGGTITGLTIAYTGEQWRLGASGRTDRLDFQASGDATSLTTGSWLDVNQLDFNAPISTGTVGALDGNSAADRTFITFSGLAWPAGATLWIRWASFDATGADDGLAIDDFSITPTGTTTSTPSVNLSVSSNVGTEAGTTVITVTATASVAVIGAQTVDLGVSGTNITAGDYTLSGNVITIPNGQTTESVTFTVVDDTLPEGDEVAVLKISNPSAGVTLGATVQQNITILDNDQAAIRIANIQGATHISPFNGQNVSGVQGIVTAVTTNGFYLQDPIPDNNPATSEAIFVFTVSAPTVVAGDALSVSGKVQEFRPANSPDNLTITELTSPVVTKLSSGNALPAAVVLGVDRIAPTQSISTDGTNVETGGTFNPATDGIDFWESLEGMLVQVKNPLAVSPTGSGNEIWVLPNNGAGATGVNSRGGIAIAADDYNPERVQIKGLTSGVTNPVVNAGAKLSDVTGVITYGSSNFELRTFTSPTVTTASPITQEVTTLAPVLNKLTIATFNTQNLDPSDGAVKFGQLATAIVTNLKAPDIVNLEEIQDNNGAVNDGTVAANVTLQTLINAITAAGGPAYQYRQIDPVNGTNGGEPGGNIRVAFLFNPDRVSFVDSSLTLIDPTNSAFTGSRKPLVGNFVFNGETVTVIGNHFTSKGGDDPLYGPTQPPVLSSEVQRNAQATVVKNYVQALTNTNPDAKIVVLGDLNDFQFAQPLSLLKSAGLTALVETLPANERYTYNFQGNEQAIDHILSSKSLTDKLDGVDVVHINAEFAVQVSDHDPVLARFLIEPKGLVITGTAGRDTLVGTAGTDVITGGPGRDILTGGASADQFVYTSVLDAGDIITDFTAGSDKLVISALLASVGYAGTNPVVDGYLTTSINASGTTVLFDLDGSAGANTAIALVTLTGVAVSDPAVLLNPSLFVGPG